MDSRLYWIWLSRAVPLGDECMNTLLDTFGDARDIYAAPREELARAVPSKTVLDRLCDCSLDEAHRILDRTLADGDWLLTPVDALYPICLRRLVGLPAVLYCRGVMPDLDVRPAIAVVGTRRATENGKREAFALSGGLAAGGMTVVSGGACGIDAAAHRGALAVGGCTIAVLACPLDVEYPAENTDLRREIVARGGLLVSEYPSALPYRCIFPIRNRLIAGLSQGVCLAETPVRSGARITARLAREQSREVFALPGALSGHRNDGAHREIQDGAMLVMRTTEIVEEYAPLFPGMLDADAAAEAQEHLESAPDTKEDRSSRERYKSRKHSEAAPDAKLIAHPATVPDDTPPVSSENAVRVWQALTAQPQPVDLLAQATALPVPVLLAALTELEMLGRAANSAGQQYHRI